MVKSSWLFFLARTFFRLVFKLCYKWQIEGAQNIPKEGGLIIAPNHTSLADPPLTGSAMDRPLFFMAKQELFDIPGLGFVIRRTHAFPVKRGKGDIGAFRTTLSLLAEGKAVLVFPEGTRSRDGNFGIARPGVGMLACTAQVPIVPVRLVNSNKLSSFLQIKVVFGKPIYPPKDYNKESYQKLSETVLETIKNLYKEQ